MAVVLTVRCTSSDGRNSVAAAKAQPAEKLELYANKHAQDSALAAWSKAAKASGYIGPDAVKNCYVAHDGIFAKLQLCKHLITCLAPGCKFEARRKYKMKSVPDVYKMNRHLEGVQGWNA